MELDKFREWAEGKTMSQLNSMIKVALKTGKIQMKDLGDIYRTFGNVNMLDKDGKKRYEQLRTLF